MSAINNFMERLRRFPLPRYLPIYFNATERRWFFQALVIGVTVWAVVYVLRIVVEVTFDWILAWLESMSSPLWVFLPLGVGSLIVAVLARVHSFTLHYQDASGHQHALNDVEGDGVERAISLYFSSEPNLEHTLLGEVGVDARWHLPTFSLAIRKFIATIATLGLGGSGGLEASVTLIGESFAAGLFKPHRVVEAAQHRVNLIERLWAWWGATNPDDLQTAQLGGIGAAMTTLLGAPFAGAFFAIEVMYRRRPIIERLIYALIPSLIAYFLTNLVTRGHTTLFKVDVVPTPPSTLSYYLVIFLVAALLAVIGLYFNRLRTAIDSWFHRLPVKGWQRHLIGAAITGTIALVAAEIAEVSFGYPGGLELVLGPGEGPILTAMAGKLTLGVAMLALIAKLFATLSTIGSGGSAGLLVPSIFFGAMLASGISTTLGWNPLILIIPAIAGSLVSIVNIPLAAIMFIVEVFGAQYLLPTLVTLVITSTLAHQNNIYRTVREQYDNRQIMPGYSVRRVPVPPAWEGQSLLDLRLRNRFGVNVIGVVITHAFQNAYHQHIQPNPDLMRPLSRKDILVVLGGDKRLDRFEAAASTGELPPLREEDMAVKPKMHDH